MSNRVLKKLEKQGQQNNLEGDIEEPLVNYERKNVFKNILPEEECNIDFVYSEPKPEKLKKRNKKKKSCVDESTTVNKSYNTNENIDQLKINDDNCLTVDFSNLNYTNEMKKLFGGAILDNKIDKKFKRYVRKSKFCIPKIEWLPLKNIGLTMELINKENDILCFVFRHLSKYQIIQEKFCSYASSLNQSSLIELYRENPYHVDSLIQMSVIMRFHNDYDIGATMIEQALYAMESEFHPRFNLTNSDAKLPYIYRENRSFHIALFYHMCTLNYKACFRTSLEICKLSLNLDPTDPLAILAVIDRLALKSRQYTFLINLYLQYKEILPLHKYPNIIYSTALACKLQQLGNLTTSNPTPSTKNSKKNIRNYNPPLGIPLSDTDLENMADDILINGLQSYPWVLFSLAKQCGIEESNLLAAFEKDNKNIKKFFQTARKTKKPALLQKLVEQYADDCQPFWRQLIPEVSTDEYFLFDWIVNVISKNMDLSFQDPDVFMESVKHFQEPIPLNICRHYTLLSQFLDSMSQTSFSNPSGSFRITPLTPQGYNGSIHIYDPFPPTDSINGYIIHQSAPQFPAEYLTLGQDIPGQIDSNIYSLDALNRSTNNDDGNNSAPIDISEISRIFRGFLVSLIPPNPLTGSGDVREITRTPTNQPSENVFNSVRNFFTAHRENPDEEITTATSNDAPTSSQSANHIQENVEQGVTNSHSNPNNEPETSSRRTNNNNVSGIEIIHEGFESNRSRDRSSPNRQ